MHRLDTGWSVKSNQIQSNTPKADPINDCEQKMILKVINKAKQMEKMERDRIK